MNKYFIRLMWLIVLALITAVPIGAWAQTEAAGVVKTVKGQALVERGKAKIPLKMESKIYKGDVLVTGENSSLGVVFTDDTLLSLGPETRLEINDYLFKPAQESLSFFNRLVKGTAAYVSGQIVKLSPESAKVETPLAVLGIRGTRFVVQAD